jgi:hypothetical protein
VPFPFEGSADNVTEKLVKVPPPPDCTVVLPLVAVLDGVVLLISELY